MFPLTGLKNLGSVGRDFFFIIYTHILKRKKNPRLAKNRLGRVSGNTIFFLLGLIIFFFYYVKKHVSYMKNWQSIYKQRCKTVRPNLKHLRLPRWTGSITVKIFLLVFFSICLINYSWIKVPLIFIIWRYFVHFSPDIAYIQRDNVMLPALKQTMGNKAIERRKRTQILQKARVRREVLHWPWPLTSDPFLYRLRVWTLCH